MPIVNYRWWFLLAPVVTGALLLFARPCPAQCESEATRQVARAVKLACNAYDRAARRGEVVDTSKVARAKVAQACRDAAVFLCDGVAQLCYGNAYDAATTGFPVRVSDRCARRIGRSCTGALAKEIRSPGTAARVLGRLSRACADPITADLGGACDGVTGNAAARACLETEIAVRAGAIAPPSPTPIATPTPIDPPPDPAQCGFPGTVLKPVVPGTELDPDMSPWRSPIPSGAAYESAATNQTQMSYVKPSAPDRVNLSLREWTYPIYNIVSDAAADCPSSIRSRCFDQVVIRDVYLTQPWNPTGYAIRHVPIPAAIEMRPDPKADSHLAVVDWVHGIEYDFWACLKNADGSWKQVKWPVTKGGDGQLHYACQAGGKVWFKGTGINVIGPDSAKGSGFALTAGLIRPDELAGGGIGHALAISITAPAGGGPIPPANLSDGTGPAYPSAPPEGARLQLRSDVWTDAVIDAQSWTGVEKKIARALRDYGALISDSGGSDVDFYAEGTAYDSTMYDGIAGIDPGARTSVFTDTFFTATNFRILQEQAQHGSNDDGSRDLDGDGMFDSFEVAMGWADRYEAGSPANAGDDPDGDGLTNLEEQRCLYTAWPEYLQSWSGFAQNPAFQYPCNPYDADTDHDGFTDPAELAAATDPTDPCSHP